MPATSTRNVFPPEALISDMPVMPKSLNDAPEEPSDKGSACLDLETAQPSVSDPPANSRPAKLKPIIRASVDRHRSAFLETEQFKQERFDSFPKTKPDTYAALKARAASMLALGMRLNDVASKLGIHRNTLAKWLEEDSEFEILCEKEIVAIRDEIRASATGAYMGALEILQNIAMGAVNTVDRIKACAAILQYTSPTVTSRRFNQTPNRLKSE